MYSKCGGSCRYDHPNDRGLGCSATIECSICPINSSNNSYSINTSNNSYSINSSNNSYYMNSSNNRYMPLSV